MSIDVTTSRLIRSSREDVAQFVMDWRNDRRWIGGIREVELLGTEPFGVGSDVRRVASFLGRTIEYVNRVEELEPGRALRMRSIKSPIPMEVTYSFADDAAGTRASVRILGEPGGLFRLGGPLLPRMVRRSVARDLERLQQLLEP